MNILTYEQQFMCKQEKGLYMETGTEKLTEYVAVNESVVEEVLKKQPPEEHLYDLADLFKMFGDSTRIRILYALSTCELCVGDIAQILSLGQSTVSHQLRVLKYAKLVKFRRDGKVIFYALADEHVRTIINMGMEHVEEE